MMFASKPTIGEDCIRSRALPFGMFSVCGMSEQDDVAQLGGGTPVGARRPHVARPHDRNLRATHVAAPMRMLLRHKLGCLAKPPYFARSHLNQRIEYRRTGGSVNGGQEFSGPRHRRKARLLRCCRDQQKEWTWEVETMSLPYV